MIVTFERRNIIIIENEVQTFHLIQTRLIRLSTGSASSFLRSRTCQQPLRRHREARDVEIRQCRRRCWHHNCWCFCSGRESSRLREALETKRHYRSWRVVRAGACRRHLVLAFAAGASAWSWSGCCLFSCSEHNHSDCTGTAWKGDGHSIITTTI